jgi:hypothetical protein
MILYPLVASAGIGSLLEVWDAQCISNDGPIRWYIHRHSLLPCKRLYPYKTLQRAPALLASFGSSQPASSFKRNILIGVFVQDDGWGHWNLHCPGHLFQCMRTRYVKTTLTLTFHPWIDPTKRDCHDHWYYTRGHAIQPNRERAPSPDHPSDFSFLSRLAYPRLML